MRKDWGVLVEDWTELNGAGRPEALKSTESDLGGRGAKCSGVGLQP